MVKVGVRVKVMTFGSECVGQGVWVRVFELGLGCLGKGKGKG